MTPALRAARESEAAFLSALILRSKAHWGYSAGTMEGWRTLLKITAEEIRERPTFAAEVDGEIAGFYSLRPSKPAWDLDNLWVLPEFMRRGIGRCLLAHALETAARGGALEVTVDSEPKAEPFYLHAGAVRRGEIAAPIAGEPGRVRPQLAFTIVNHPTC